NFSVHVLFFDRLDYMRNQQVHLALDQRGGGRRRVGGEHLGRHARKGARECFGVWVDSPWNDKREWRLDSRSITLERNPTATAIEAPTRSSPAVGSARNSISLTPCMSSSKT